MRKTLLFLIIAGCMALPGKSQLRIDNATFFISAGATVTVQGDVTSNVDIQGTGLLQLKGSVLQNVDMGGNTIPNLELDNTANATLLNTNTRIGTSMLFTNGKFQTGNLNLILGSAATVTGANNTRFVWTNGTGQLMKQLTADVAAFELPVGENTNYRPAYLTTSGAVYSSASFGVRVLGTADVNKPPMIASFINTHWPVTRTGITGGSVSLSGQYIDPTDITGTEANLVGYYSNGTDWSSVGETHSAVLNRVGAVVSGNGTVSGMNKFLAVGARAFLQGSYVPATGLMADNGLRLLPFGPSSSTANFPQTDPYRVVPYSGVFTHVNNAAVETIPNSGVIGAQADAANNIVDWVFIQLRDLTASPGNVVLQTRSALIQRDGDIVDIDGISPVTFNGLADGNYCITIRHRNHIGLSIDQTAGGAPKSLSETKSTAFTTNVIDLRTQPDANLFGNAFAYTSAAHPGLGTIRMLWAGNANVNTGVKYVAPSSDNATILSQVLGFPGNTLGLFNYAAAVGYFSGDINLNRTVKYTAPSADGSIILTNILSLSPLFNFAGLNQQIPN
jgi:hypothetical protein